MTEATEAVGRAIATNAMEGAPRSRASRWDALVPVLLLAVFLVAGVVLFAMEALANAPMTGT